MQTQASSMLKLIYKKKWLTIIEVIIAIFVFWIGILWVMKIMTQNIWLVDNAKLISTATLLWKEAMEMAYNHRDTNLLLAYNWQCERRDKNIESEYWCTNVISSGNTTYTIDKNQSGFIELSTVNINNNFWENFNNTQLYITKDSSNWEFNQRYTHQNNWSWSNYARYIEFEKVLSWSLSEKVDQNILKITTKTLYQKWSLTWVIILESIIGKKE